MEKLKSELEDLRALNGAKVENSIVERMAKQLIEVDTKVAELQKDNHLAHLKNQPKKDQRDDGASIDGVEVNQVPNANLFKSQFELFTEQMGSRFTELNARMKDIEQGHIMIASRIGE